MTGNRVLLLMCVVFTAVPVVVEWAGGSQQPSKSPGLALLLDWPFPYAYWLLMAAAFGLHGLLTDRGTPARRTVAALKGVFVGAMGFVLVLLIVTQVHLR